MDPVIPVTVARTRSLVTRLWSLFHAMPVGAATSAVLVTVLFAGCGNRPPATPPATGSSRETGTSNGPPKAQQSSAAAGNVSTKGEASEPAKGTRRAIPVLQKLPAFALLDQAGQPVTEQSVEGRVWIASFAPLTQAPAGQTLATTVGRIGRQLQRWPDTGRIQVLSLWPHTAGPVADEIRSAATGLKADPAFWRLVHGAEAGSVAQLLESGFRLVGGAGGQAAFEQLAVVDAQLRVRGFFDATTDSGVRAMLAALREVLNEPGADATQPHITHVAEPEDLMYAPWMEDRAAAQEATRPGLPQRNDFRFEDRLAESGITFRNQAVSDSSRDWKMNHYDHANGLAAADIDGDGLLDLYFPSQIGGSELWRNLGGGRFEDVTEASGTRLLGRVAVSASFADIDNDGDPDLYVTTTRFGNALFVNDGQGHFRDQTEEAGLAYTGHSSSAEFFDYDRDGLLDLFLVNVGKFTEETVGQSVDREGRTSTYYIGMKEAFAAHLYPERTEPSVLYRNLGGGKFEDVSEETGLVDTGWSGDATPLDANGDGWTDLYVLSMQGNDEYWENLEGRRFERRSTTLLPAYAWGSMGVKVIDFNNDGRPDIYTTNMHADMWEEKPYGVGEKEKSPPAAMPESYFRSRVPGKNVLGNAFYLAKPGGGYEEVSERVNSENYWPWGLSAGDLNGDGWQDVFITSCMNLKWRYHPNSLLLNRGGERFDDAEFLVGVEPRRGGAIAAPWYQLDCDGPDSGHPQCAGRSGRVQVWGALGSRGSVIADLDADGDLDIVTNDFHTPPMVLISDLRQRHPGLQHLSVVLRGAKSNRDGLGARVTVRSSAGSQVQFHDGQSGYLSQSSQPLHFGFEADARVEEIRVTWPTGREQVLTGPFTLNQRLLIEEPAE
jgi:hypothetical protein